MAATAATAVVDDADRHRFRQITLQHPISKAADGSVTGGWTEAELRALFDTALAKVCASPPEPWADLGLTESLMDARPAPGRVVSTTPLKKIGQCGALCRAVGTCDPQPPPPHLLTPQQVPRR